MHEYSDSEELIIERAIAGDESAYRYLLETNKAFAFTIALRIVRNREDAEEIVQDSFIKAFRSIGRFKRSGKFTTWLYKIIYNTALSSIRGGKVKLDQLDEHQNYELSLPSNYENGFDKLKNDDRLKYIKLAISNLDEIDNLMITLYYIGECNVSEINEITGWNKSTIKVRLFRARQKIYVELSKLLDKELIDLL
jgi:RNA polymerase sigma factor (sigma-70 family)